MQNRVRWRQSASKQRWSGGTSSQRAAGRRARAGTTQLPQLGCTQTAATGADAVRRGARRAGARQAKRELAQREPQRITTPRARRRTEVCGVGARHAVAACAKCQVLHLRAPSLRAAQSASQQKVRAPAAARAAANDASRHALLGTRRALATACIRVIPRVAEVARAARAPCSGTAARRKRLRSCAIGAAAGKPAPRRLQRCGPCSRPRTAARDALATTRGALATQAARRSDARSGLLEGSGFGRPLCRPCGCELLCRVSTDSSRRRAAACAHEDALNASRRSAARPAKKHSPKQYVGA